MNVHFVQTFGYRTALILCLAFLGGVSTPVEARTSDKASTSTKPLAVAPGLDFWVTTEPSTSGPVVFHVLKIDLSRPEFELHAQPGSGRLFTGQAPDRVHERLRKAGMNVLASMNADFWSSSQPGRFYRPVGLHVTDGILATTSTSRSTLIVDDSGKVRIGTVDLAMDARLGTKAIPVADLNNTYTTSGLVVFTNPFGQAIEAATTRPLAIVALEKSGPRANETVSGKVREVLTTGKATPDHETVVLAFNQDSLEQVPSASTPVALQARLLGYSGSVAEAVGGGPRIVHRGSPSAEADGTAEKVGRAFVRARHPRTAVGLSKDTKTMWWVVVDGRQPGYSAGINLPDLGRFLSRLGAWEAINLDGGGSSCLVLDGRPVNRPSDKGQTVRPVCNTLHLIRK